MSAPVPQKHSADAPYVPYAPPYPILATPPRRVWARAWVRVLLALVLLALVGGGVVAQRYSERVLRPGNIARGYYDAMAAHDWNRAHGYLSASLRGQHTPAMLEAMWRGQESGPYGVPMTPSPDNVRVETVNGRMVATVEMSYGTTKGASMYGAEVYLVREGGQWRLDALP